MQMATVEKHERRGSVDGDKREPNRKGKRAQGQEKRGKRNTQGGDQKRKKRQK